jgi:hypothetical protein
VGDGESYGAVVDDGIVDLRARLPQHATLRDLIAADALNAAHVAMRNVAPDHPLASVTLLPPIPAPEKIWCIGVNYAERNDEEAIQVIGVRRRIAIKMQESKRRIPHFAYVEEIDVTEVEALRAQLNAKWAEQRPRLTLLPLLARAIVLAVREQHLTPQTLHEVARRFGPFSGNPIHGPMEGFDDIVRFEREPDDTGKVIGEEWHMDLAWMAKPPGITLLFGEVIPPLGGDTCFASLEHTYRSLTPRMQELLAGLTGIHSGKGVVAVNAVHKHLGGSLPGSTTSVT